MNRRLRWFSHFGHRCRRRFPRRHRGPLLEQLERREMLFAALQDLHLVNDTGTPANLITTDPTVAGTVTGDFQYGAQVEFDHNNDGIYDGSYSIWVPDEEFTYDPRDNDPNLEGYSGTFPLQVRVVEYDEYYMPMEPGAPVDFTFTIGQEGGGGLEVEIEVVDPYWMTINDGTGSFDFGETFEGTPISYSFSITNEGADELELDDQSLMLPSGFSVVTPFASTVAGYGQTTLTVQLDAEMEGYYSGQLSFDNSDSNESPFNFAISGTVTSEGGSEFEPEIEVLDGEWTAIDDGSGTVNFGETTVGTPVTLSFIIQNSGMDDLTLDANSLSLPSGYSLVSGFASAVASGNQTGFTVRLDAAAEGTFQGTLSFANNDADEDPFTFTLTGVVGSGDEPDVPGDELADAQGVTLQPTWPQNLEEQIGDGLHADYDVDLYRVTLSADQTLQMDVDASLLDDGDTLSNLNSYIRLFDDTGTELATNNNGTAPNDFGSGTDSYLSYTATSNGDYYVGISGYANTQYDPTTSASGTSGSTGAYQLTLLKSWGLPALSVANITVGEGAGTGTFTVTLSSSSSATVTVGYATSNGTATAAADYTATSGTLTFSPGQTSKTVSVSVTNDNIDEANETLLLTLSNPTNATISTASATATITDNDQSVLSFTDTDPSVSEDGESVTLVVELSNPSNSTVTVNYATSDVSAEADSDYTGASGTLTFAPGETSKEIVVTILDDAEDESNEDFHVTLSNPTNATAPDPEATVSIVDDEEGAPPTVGFVASFGSESETVNEIVLTVQLSEASSDTVEVDFATSNISATSGSDYIGTSGTLTFAPGVTSQTITVEITDDTSEEAHEQFRVTLSAPVNSTLATAQMTVTILDNDQCGDPPGDTFQHAQPVNVGAGDDYIYYEEIGNGLNGQSDIDFYQVYLSRGDRLAVDVDAWFLDDGSSLSTLNSYLRVFNETETVVAKNDDGLAADDHLYVNGGFGESNIRNTEYSPYADHDSYLSFTAAESGYYYIGATGAPNNGYGSSGGGAVTGSTGEYRLKLRRYAATPDITASVTLTDVSVEEGGDAIFTITLSEGSSDTIQLTYRTRDGSAVPYDDYLPSSGTITFDPQETEKTISIPTEDDGLWEGDESFLFEVTGPANVHETATATIVNDTNDYNQGHSYSSDFHQRLITVENVEVSEGGQARFEVRFNGWWGPGGIPEQPFSVGYQTRNRTAQSGSDYVAASGSVTFLPSGYDANENYHPADYAHWVTIDTLTDWQREPGEQFYVDFSTPWGDHPIAVATVRDRSAPRLRVSDLIVVEGQPAEFLVQIAPQPQPVTINYHTQANSAAAVADFEEVFDDVTIPAGENQVVISIPTKTDWQREPDEFFYLEVSSPWGDHAVAEARLRDNLDTIPHVSFDAAAWNVWEGNSLEVGISLDKPYASAVTVGVGTMPGSAAECIYNGTNVYCEDYQVLEYSVTFEPGQTHKVIEVEALLDNSDENIEHFYLEVDSPREGLSVTTVNIQDEEYPDVRVLPTSASVPDGNTLTFQVGFNVEVWYPVSVSYSTFGGTAQGTYCEDYCSEGGTLYFQPGEAWKTVEIQTTEHNDDYQDENGNWIHPPRPNVHFFFGAQTAWNDFAIAKAVIEHDGIVGHPNPAPAINAVNDSINVHHDSGHGAGEMGYFDWGSLLGNDVYVNQQYNYLRDRFTASTVTEVQHGTLQFFANGMYEYIPDAGFVGTDSFQYAVTDGVASDTATVTFHVTNDIPDANNDTFDVWHDTLNNTTYLSVIDNDVDLDALSATILAPVEHGTLTLLANGKFNYTPVAGFVGTDSFTYSVSDGIASDTAEVTIRVHNDVPVAEPDPEYLGTPGESIYEGLHLVVWHDSINNWSQISVLENDWEDADGSAGSSMGNLGGTDYPTGSDALRATLVSQPQNGRVTMYPNGKFNYTPRPGFEGPDTFTYSATDGAGSSTATVTITIRNELDAHADPFDEEPCPECLVGVGYSIWTHAATSNPAPYNGDSDGFYVWNDDTVSTYDLLVDGVGILHNDADRDLLKAELVECGSTVGIVELDGDGAFKYYAPPGFAGDDSFAYRVTDGVTTETRTVRLSVHRDDNASYNDWYIPFEEAVYGEHWLGYFELTDDFDWWRFSAVDCGEPTGPEPVVGFYTMDHLAADDSFVKHYYEVQSVTYRHYAVTEPDSYAWNEHLGQWDVYSNYNEGSYSPSQFTDENEIRFGWQGIVYAPIAEPVEWADLLPNYDWYEGVAADALMAVDEDYILVLNGSPFEYHIANDSFTVAETLFHRLQEGDLGWSQRVEESTTVAWYTAGDQRFLQRFLEGDSAYRDSVNFYDVGYPAVTVDWGQGDDSTVTFDVFDLAQAYGNRHLDPYVWSSSPNRTWSWDLSRLGMNSFEGAFWDHGGLRIEAGHMYTASGIFPISLTISGLDHPLEDYTGFGGIENTDRYALVGDASLTATGRDDLTSAEGAPMYDVVATFTDENIFDSAASYKAWIDWGDQTPQTRGQVFGSGGNFEVRGTAQHQYRQDGSYTIRIRIVDKDGVQVSTTSTVLVGNVAPVAVDDTYTASHGKPFVVADRDGVVANDIDPSTDLLTARLLQRPTKGTVVLNLNGSFTYTPNPMYLGLDTFTYRVGDDDESGTVGTVTLELINDPPIAGSDSFTVSHDRKTALAVQTDDTDIDLDKLTPIIVDAPQHGTVKVQKDGTIAYTPHAAYLGADSFSYKLRDPFVTGTTVATVSLLVKNDRPVAVPDTWTISHDRTFSANVTSNDTDGDQDALTVHLVDDVQHGLLELDTDGQFVYSPDPGFLGVDTFTYYADDGIWDTLIATVTLTVSNHIPTLSNATYNVIHDRVLQQPLPAVDQDQDELQVLLKSAPTHGILDISTSGRFTYTPNEGYVGTDAFTYSLFDGIGESNQATITINVTNQPPVGDADEYIVWHDREFVRVAPGVLSNDVDSDGDAKSLTLLTTTTHGQLDLRDDGSFTYTPDTHYSGDDEFVYLLSDGIESAFPVTVLLHVQETPPVVTNDTFTLWPHDQTLIDNVGRNDHDAEQDTLTYELLTPPAGGTFHFRSNGEFAYSPPPNHAGSISFTYRAFDGLLYSNGTTVTIAISQHPPTVPPPTFTINHDARLVGNVLSTAQDLENTWSTVEPLTAELLSDVAHGEITFNSNGAFTYVPTAGYYGSDSFTFRVSDGRAYTTTTTAQINLVETAPVVRNDTFRISHDRLLTGNVSGNDSDAEGDDILYFLVDALSGASITDEQLNLPGDLHLFDNGLFEFIPDPEYVGAFTFAYRGRANMLESQVAVVTVEVVQTSPRATDDFFVVGYGRELDQASVFLNDHDAEGDTLTYVLVNPATELPVSAGELNLQGTLSWNGDGHFDYTAPNDWYGFETFAYKAIDDLEDDDLAIVTIQVTRTAPVAHADGYTILHDTFLTGAVLSNDSDADEDTLTARLVNDVGEFTSASLLGLHGSLNWNINGAFTYVPQPGWYGTEKFEYQAFDTLDHSEAATVTITVQENRPVVGDNLYRVRPGQVFRAPAGNHRYRPHLLVNDSDANNDPFQISWHSEVEHGQLDLESDGTFTYTPDTGFRGVDGFRYRISDGLLESHVAQVTFIVDNRAPTAKDDVYQTLEGISVQRSVVFNDWDSDRDRLVATLVNPATEEPITTQQLELHGTLEWDGNGGFTYQSEAGYEGVVSFAYKLSDTMDESDMATVTISVSAIPSNNKAPLARNDRFMIKPGQTLTVGVNEDWNGNPQTLPLLFNDRDPEGDPLLVLPVNLPAHGVLQLQGDGSFTYTPNAGFEGQDQFRYKLSDGPSESAIATVTIHVLNHPPLAKAAAYQLQHDTILDTELLPAVAGLVTRGLGSVAADANRDTLIFHKVVDVTHGSLTLLSDGNFSYAPHAGFTGFDTFQYRVHDGLVYSGVATVTLNVANSRPVAAYATFSVGHDHVLAGNVPALLSGDGDQATANLAGGPFYGTLDLNTDGSFVYTPAEGFVGQDSFTYFWQDEAASATEGLKGNFARITINVTWHAPEPADDEFSFDFHEGPNYSGNVLLNDVDDDADVISSLLVPPLNGSVSLAADGTFVFTPAAGFYGTNQFTYRASDGRYASLATTATIHVSPLSVQPVSAAIAVLERQELTAQLVTFESLLEATALTDYSATIDWGDGQTSAGVISLADGTYLVTGAHVYGRDADFDARVTVTHVDGYTRSATKLITVSDAGPTIHPSALTAIKGMPIQQVLASFSDDAGTNPDEYLATVDWGDGQQSQAEVSGDGIYQIRQGHLYDQRGVFTITVTLLDPDGDTTVFTNAVDVSHEVLVHGVQLAPVQGQSVQGVVAKFTSNSNSAMPEHFIATIDWGDGLHSPGMINGKNGQFTVSGLHTYQQPGSYSINVVVTEDDPYVTVVNVGDQLTAIKDPNVRTFGKNLEIDENEELDTSISLLEFTSSEIGAAVGDFQATINWGDNSLPTTGSVTAAGLQFAVSGQHTYREEGGYIVEVKLTHDDKTTIAQSSILVLGRPLSGTPRTVKAPREAAVVGRFTDPDADSGPGDFSAKAVLGPGQHVPAFIRRTTAAEVETIAHGFEGSYGTSPVTEMQQITLNSNPTGGTFILCSGDEFSGNHCTSPLAYDASPSDIESALESLPDIDNVDVLSVGTGSFTITFLGAQTDTNVAEIQANGTNLTGRQNEFDILMDIGGETPPVVELRVYEGTQSRVSIVSTIVQPTAGAASSSAGNHSPSTLPPAVNSNPSVFETRGMTVNVVEGVVFSGAVALFTGDAGNWEAQINWGDGATSDGIFSASEILGSHTYHKPGVYQITVALNNTDALSPPGMLNHPGYYGPSWTPPGKYWSAEGGWYYPPSWNSDYWRLGGPHEWYLQSNRYVVSGVVVEANSLTASPSASLTGQAHVELTDQTLVTTNAGDNAVAVVEWGDGEASEGTITGGDIKGTHTYAEPGFYKVRVTIRDGSQLKVVSLDVDIEPETPWNGALTPSDPGDITGVEDQELVNLVVAKIDDKNPRHIGGLHHALIAWGDGTSSPGQIVAATGTLVEVQGTHTYRDAGAYDIRVTYRDQLDEVVIHATALIDASNFTVVAKDISAVIGIALENVVVADFTVSNSNSERTAADYRATIHWGDGIAENGSLVRVDNTYVVFGTHRYIQTGDFELTVTVEDGPVTTQSKKGTGTAHVGLAYEGGPPINIFDGASGYRPFTFDFKDTCRDTHETHHQFNGSWDAAFNRPDASWSNSWSGAQTWDGYAGICTLKESIQWEDDNQVDLLSSISFATGQTTGTLGTMDAWGWVPHGWEFGNGTSGWSGTSGSFDPAYEDIGWGWDWGGLPGAPWHGNDYGFEPSVWSQTYYDIAYFGWVDFAGTSSGYPNWGWSWRPWVKGWWVDTWRWPFGEPDSDSASDDTSWDWTGWYGNNSLNRSWANSQNITTTEASFSHSHHFDQIWDYSFGPTHWANAEYDLTHHFQSEYYAYAGQAGGTLFYAYENDGPKNISTSFGLNRAIYVADELIQDPDSLPILFGEEDTATPVTTLATFNTSDWGAAGSGLTVQIDWGDGNADPGTLIVTPDNRLAIQGSHTYSDEGKYSITMLVKGGGTASRLFFGEASIIDPDLAIEGKDLHAAAEISTGEVLVATITDWRTNSEDESDHFFATIQWGDEEEVKNGSGVVTGHKPSLSRGTIKAVKDTAGNVTSYEVYGSHTYEEEGEYDILVRIEDRNTPPVTSKKQVKVGPGLKIDAQRRTNGFDEGYLESFGTGSIALNTGGVRIAHELDFDISPGTSVAGEPLLFYNSDTTNVRPIIEATVENSGNDAISEIKVQLTWDDRDAQAWKTFTVSNPVAGDDLVVAAQVDGKVEQSGLYPWTIQLQVKFTSQPDPVYLFKSGWAQVVVFEDGDEEPGDAFDYKAFYGAGWGISGVDRLLIEEDLNLLWITASGDHTAYWRQPDGTYKGAVNDYGSMVLEVHTEQITTPSGTQDQEVRELVYTAQDQTTYRFNHLGLLIEFKSPSSPPQLYEYNDEGQLEEVTAPDFGVTTLQYSGMRVDTITEPGSRIVDLSIPGEELDLITDVDGSERRFTYSGNHDLTKDHWGPASSEYVETSFEYDSETELVSKVVQGEGTSYLIDPAAGLTLPSTPLRPDEILGETKSEFMYPGSGQPLLAKYSLDVEGRILTYKRPDEVTLVWERDDFHNVLRYTNERGLVTTYEYFYNGNGGLVKTVTAPDQGETQFEYHPSFKSVTKLTTQMAADSEQVTTFEYTGLGQLKKTIDPYNKTVTNNWSGYDLESTVDKRGNTTKFFYDPHRRLASLQDPLGVALGYSTVYQYDNAGNLMWTTDNMGIPTFFDYDERNRLRSVTDYYNQSTTYDYDAAGNLLLSTDPMGVQTKYEYDVRGWQKKVHAAWGTQLVEMTATEYWPDGTVHVVTDPLLHTTTYEPVGPPSARKTKSTDKIGFIYFTTTDAGGNVEEVEGPLSQQSRKSKFTYDGANRLKKVTQNAAFEGAYIEYGYDFLGNRTSFRDEMGYVTKFGYDDLSRLTSILDPENHTTAYEYDPNGNVLLETNANGAETAYGYDPNNRRDRLSRHDNGVLVSDWGGFTETYGYDPNGNVDWAKNARGFVTNYVYDELNRLTDVHAPDPGTGDHGAPNTHYTYWPNGRVKRVTNPVGFWTETTYDELGRVDKVEDPGGITDFSYFVVNTPMFGSTSAYTNVRKQEVKDKEQRTTTQFFDPLGRVILTQAPQPATGAAGGPETHIEYDAFGREWLVTDPLQRQTQYLYDGYDRPLFVMEKMQGGAGSAFTQLAAYTYFPNGTVATATDRAGNTTTYNYDKLKRRETASVSNNGQTQTTTWTYDGVGNVTAIETPNLDVTTYIYDDLNRLTSDKITVNGFLLMRTYDYDAAGNLTQKTDRNGRVTEYDYDALDRRIQETWVGASNGYEAEYHYRANGQLLAADDFTGGAPNSGYGFTYDPLGQPDQVTQTLPNLSGYFLYDYDHDLEGRLEQRQLFRGGASLFTTTYAFDALDRVKSVSESGSAVQDKSVNYAYNGPILSDIYRHQAIPGTLAGDASHSHLNYSSDQRLTDIIHDDGSPATSLSAHHLEYDAQGIITSYSSELNGVLDGPAKRPDFDSQSQLHAIDDDSGNRLETYNYDRNGNRLGTRDAFDRMREDAFNHYEYDSEGHVIRRKSYEQKWSQVIDQDTQAMWSAVAKTATTVVTPTMTLTVGSYRLRLSSLTLTSPVPPGPIDVVLGRDPGLASTGSPLTIFTLNPQPTGNLNEYSTPAVMVEFTLTSNLVSDELGLTFDFTDHAVFFGPDIDLLGQFQVDRGFGTYEYTWDYRDRMTQVRVFNNPNSTGSTPTATIDYSYDVFDNRVARIKTGAPNVEPNDARFYVPEQGRLLLEYVEQDGQKRLERKRLYAANVDQLLAVEDVDWDLSGTVVSDEVIWLLTDHQGTVRDLQGVDSLTGATRTEHLSFDTFGAPQLTINEGDDIRLSDSVDVRFAGLSYDFDASHYLGDGYYYEPYSGRLLSENPLAATMGETNRYRFAGNSPVDLGGAGRPTAVNPLQAARGVESGFGEMFAHAVNPANQWHDGNYSMAIAQSAGWVLFVVGTGGAGLIGTAEVLGGGALAYAGATALTGTALTGGAVSTYVNNPDAGMHEYALNMGLNAINPIGGTVGLVGGGIGYGIDRSQGGYGKTGYLMGDFAGSLAGMGLDDVVRVAAKGGSLANASWHAAKQVGVTSAFAAGGFGAGYYASGGDLNSALFWGNMASMPGNMIAKKLVPCFAAGTPVRTPDGHKAIEELRAGDMVLSRDEHDVNSAVEAKRIEDVFVREGKILHLHVGSQVIRTTPEHPFYVKANGWTAAGELQIGNLLATEDGQWLPVEDLLDTGEVDIVYNLRVCSFHTYFVGSETWEFSVWAHNAYKVSKDLRDAAVVEAWKQEADLVRRTGQGTRNWTAKQMQQLLTTGKVRGYIGHHINSVNDSPLFAGLPENIQFLTFRQHYRIHNNGRYRIPVYGEMQSR